MATVFVWENHFIARPWKAHDHTWTGHSSLCITDTFIDTRALTTDGQVDDSSTALAQGGDDFVSFWPGTMQLGFPKTGGQYTFNDGWKIGIQFLAMSKPSIFADIALEGYAPDHVIRVTGLSVHKMVAKWRTLRGKTNAHYKFLRKNCSTAVARVLAAATPWYQTSHNLIWTPTDVRDFALKLGAPLLWTAFVQELEDYGYCLPEQLELLRQAKRRSASRGTCGAPAKFP